MKFIVNCLVGATLIFGALFVTETKATDAMSKNFFTLAEAEAFCASVYHRCIYVGTYGKGYFAMYYEMQTTNPAPEPVEPRRPGKDIKE